MQQDYEYIYAIYQTGSIKAAAEMLHVTQPAVSIALKRMEDTLQTQLFNRQSRPLQLTAAGGVLLQYITQAKMDEELMYTQIYDLTNDISGTVRIVTTHYMIHSLMPVLLADFYMRYPTVHIELTDVAAQEANARFSAGKADICISPIMLQESQVICTPIFHDKYFICVPNHFLSKDKIARYEGQLYQESFDRRPPAFIDIDQLRDMPFISMVDGSNSHEHLLKIFENADFVPRLILRVDQVSSMTALANAGIGVALVPKAFIMTTKVSHKVTFFRYNSPKMERYFYLIFFRNRYLSKAVRCFLDVCIKYIEKNLPEQKHKFNLLYK